MKTFVAISTVVAVLAFAFVVSNVPQGNAQRCILPRPAMNTTAPVACERRPFILGLLACLVRCRVCYPQELREGPRPACLVKNPENNRTMCICFPKVGNTTTSTTTQEPTTSSATESPTTEPTTPGETSTSTATEAADPTTEESTTEATTPGEITTAEPMTEQTPTTQGSTTTTTA